jgi:hypothetical protein
LLEVRQQLICEAHVQDVVDNGVAVANDTVVHVWKWWEEESRGAQRGADVVASRDGGRRCSLTRGCSGRLTEADVPGWVPELDRITKQVQLSFEPLLFPSTPRRRLAHHLI